MGRYAAHRTGITVAFGHNKNPNDLVQFVRIIILLPSVMSTEMFFGLRGRAYHPNISAFSSNSPVGHGEAGMSHFVALKACIVAF
jgi:hypothetical protein